MKRSITSSESESFLSSFLEEKYKFLGAKIENHKKQRGIEDTYTLTVDRMSNSFLNELLSDPKVMDVYYNPVHSPPGMRYGINIRYRIYIKYNKVPI
jgi:hypothetical protein